MAATIPWPVFSLHAGAIVDRHNKRVIAAAMDLILGVVTIGIVISIWADWVRLALLYVTALLIGFAEVLLSNAAQALLPLVVTDPDALERANEWQLSVEVVGQSSVGPPVGAFLFRRSGQRTVHHRWDLILRFAPWPFVSALLICVAPAQGRSRCCLLKIDCTKRQRCSV